MEIIIDDTYKLCEVQEQFTKKFPYLKLEFFELKPGEKKLCSKKDLITDTQKTIGQIRHIHYPGYISINGHQKVSTFEAHLRDVFGIDIQVFRKSGNAWLQTTTTDNWTLAEQNKKGKEMNTPVKEQVMDDYDQYHEQC